MKTLKSVTVASNSGQSRFVTKNAVSRPAELAGTVLSKDEKTKSIGVLGSRSVLSTTAVNETVVVPDTVDEAIQHTKESQKRERLGSAEVADAVAGTMEGVADDTQGGIPSGTTTSDVVIRGMITNVLENIVTDINPYTTNKTLNRIFRDMYQHDATTGSAIELMSTLPFSEFSLTGLKDEKMLKPFIDSVEAMSIGNLLPNISVDFMTVGSLILSLAFNEQKKSFVGVTPHNIDLAHFMQVPVYNIDPRISVSLPPHIVQSLKNKELFETFKDYLPKDILEQFEKEGQGGSGQRAGSRRGTNHVAGDQAGVGKFVLDSRTTIFIPRRGQFQDFRGVSILKRALPAWFYEKALMMGTTDQAYKRQRATLHITAGEGEEWIPTFEELQGFANLFMSADLDPLGSVVVTRTGVNTNEVRRGDDFWRWDQNFDMIERIKLRAMGVSETFVTGDATYANLEQALSVFIEQIRTYRGQVTRELFYEKMFPMISYANNITKQRYGSSSTRELASYGSTRAYRDHDDSLIVDIGSNMPVARELAYDDKHKKIDVSKYLIPEVVWHKRLMPEADADYMQILATMEERNVPITIRALTAAGGLKLDKLMEGLEEDLKIREKIADYKKQIIDINKEAGLTPDEEGASEFANFLTNAEMGTGSVRRKQSILLRAKEGDPAGQFHGTDHRGRLKELTPKGRSVLAERFNKNLSAAAAEMARQENARTKQEAPEPSKTYSYKS